MSTLETINGHVIVLDAQRQFEHGHYMSAASRAYRVLETRDRDYLSSVETDALTYAARVFVRSQLAYIPEARNVREVSRAFRNAQQIIEDVYHDERVVTHAREYQQAINERHPLLFHLGRDECMYLRTLGAITRTEEFYADSFGMMETMIRSSLNPITRDFLRFELAHSRFERYGLDNDLAIMEDTLYAALLRASSQHDVYEGLQIRTKYMRSFFVRDRYSQISREAGSLFRTVGKNPRLVHVPFEEWGRSHREYRQRIRVWRDQDFLNSTDDLRLREFLFKSK